MGTADATKLASKPSMQTVLTIAGFDPSSGAGVTADLMVFAAHGLFGTSCITVLTVQSTVGVAETHPVAAEVVRATLDYLTADLPPVGIKIGMLQTAANVGVVAEFLGRLRASGQSRPGAPLVVLDPVLRSSSGRELLDREGIEVMRKRLLPLVDWVTPNLDELGVLTGDSVTGREEMEHGARALQAMSGRASGGIWILAKGGHLDRPDDLVLGPDGSETWLEGQLIATKATHGTGCALSSALLSRLVCGEGPVDAAIQAKEYVKQAMRRAVPLGRGQGPMRPLWPLGV